MSLVVPGDAEVRVRLVGFMSSTPDGKSGNSRAALRRKRKSVGQPSTPAGTTENVARVESTRKKQNTLSTGNFGHLDIAGILKLTEVTEIDSTGRYEALMEHIVSPLSVSNFNSQFWQRSVYHSNRNKPAHFKGLFSKKKFDNILQENVNTTGDNIAVAGVDDGNELSFKEIEKHIARGRAVSILNPQVHIDNIWRFLFALEVGLELVVECHAVFIPASHDGFGVPINDNDSFYLQIEGSSEWKVSNSANSDQTTNIKFTMEPGDSVYIPSGWTVADRAADSADSLYLRVQTNDKASSTSSGQLIEMVLSRALEETVTKMSVPLPRRCLSFMGAARSENDEDVHRIRFFNKMKTLMG